MFKYFHGQNQENKSQKMYMEKKHQVVQSVLKRKTNKYLIQ